MTAVGQAYSALGNASAARNAFALALAAQPKYVPAHLGQARVAAAGGDLSQASAIVDKALAISPDEPEAWQLKGDILLAQKQVEPALAAFRKAIEAKPEYLPA